MQNTWQLQEAKSRFSEVVKQATRGPQWITRHGQPKAVMLSVDEYRQLTGSHGNLLEFFQQSPLAELNLDARDVLDTGRTIELGDD